MPKRLPNPHHCERCAGLAVNIHLTPFTKTANKHFWNRFASPGDRKTLSETPGLEDYLLSQLQHLVLFGQTTTSQVLEHAQNGCLVFKYIHERVSGTLIRLRGGGREIEPMDDHKPFQECLSRSGDPPPAEEEHILILIEPQPGKFSTTFRFRWFVSPYRPFHAMHFEAPESRRGCHKSDDWVDIDPFQMMVTNQSPFEHYMPRDMNYEPETAGALEFFKNRFQKYMETEKSEATEESGEDHPMPSRLLEIDFDAEEKRVRLVETAELRDVSYAALSYCWGGPQEVQLKTENKSLLFDGLALKNLPKTLRDAAHVSVKLGLSYIWIDAMCIIQDDAEDKARELSRMSQIYEYAAITIAASRASSVHEGFLQERLPFKDTSETCFMLPCIEPLDLSKQTGEDMTVGVAVVFPLGDMMDYSPPEPGIPEKDAVGIPHNPLIKRAWALQERGLSRRIIDFGLYGTRLHARDLEGRVIASVSDGWKAFDSINEPPNFLREDTRSTSAALRKWQFLLPHYTRLRLSFSSDRLLALAAFARFFSRAFGGAEEYLAGIWKPSLPLGLLWHTHGGKKAQRDTNPHRGKGDDLPDERVPNVPTWSWAAVTRQISYPFDLAGDELQPDQGAKILSHRIDLESELVKFGTVVRGELRTCGRLRPVRLSLKPRLDWGYDEFSMTRSEDVHRYFSVDQGMTKTEDRGLYIRNDDPVGERLLNIRLPFTILLDTQEEVIRTMVGDSSALFALPIASGPFENAESVGDEPASSADMSKLRRKHGLLLLKRDEGVYERLAYFSSHPQYTELSTADTWVFDSLEDAQNSFQEHHEWMDGGEVSEFSII